MLSPGLSKTLRLLHRWAGLTLAGFLVVVALTGSLLAFYSELEHWLAPQFYVAEQPGRVRLSMGEVAERALRIEPRAYVTSVYLREAGRAEVQVSPRTSAELDFDELLLDPYTGAELGRRTWGDITQGVHNLMPFIYRLHYELALGMTGMWVLGIVALLWTLDSIVGLLITLPVRLPAPVLPVQTMSHHGWWSRWKKSWLIKRGASVWRFNFDLHRAGSLWLWGMLLMFAWSSVYMNLWDSVYTWSTRAVMEFHPPWTELSAPLDQQEVPTRNWREVQATAERLMNEEARAQGFSIIEPVRLEYRPEYGAYLYRVRSTLDVNERLGKTDLYFDAHTSAITLRYYPSRQFAGNTVTSWLAALHMGQVFGLSYRIFLSTYGLMVAIISVTGVLIWWHRRRNLRRSGLTFAERSKQC